VDDQTNDLIRKLTQRIARRNEANIQDARAIESLSGRDAPPEGKCVRHLAEPLTGGLAATSQSVGLACPGGLTNLAAPNAPTPATEAADRATTLKPNYTMPYNAYPRDVTSPGPYQQRGVVKSQSSAASSGTTPTQKPDSDPKPKPTADPPATQ
jgi:hypothetical protein